MKEGMNLKGILAKVIFCWVSLIFMTVVSEKSAEAHWTCWGKPFHWHCGTDHPVDPPKPPSPPPPPVVKKPFISLSGYTFPTKYCNSYGSYMNCIYPATNSAHVNAWKGGFSVYTPSKYIKSDTIGFYKYCPDETLCLDHDPKYVLQATSADDAAWSSGLVTVRGIEMEQRVEVYLYMVTDCVGTTDGGFTCGGSYKPSVGSNVKKTCYKSYKRYKRKVNCPT